MILTAHNLPRHLLERGMIDWATAVAGDVRIVEIPRRHRNFQVWSRTGPGLFVKQVQSWDAHTVSCLRREGTCGWLAANDATFAPVRRRIPAFRDYDPARSALIVELLPAAEGLGEYHQRRAAYPPPIGAEIGRTLGDLHGRVPIAADRRLSALFPRSLPTILTLHQAPPGSLRAYGPAAQDLVRQVKQDGVFVRAFTALARDWRPSALIHGDVKLDNLLLTGPNGRPHGDGPRLKLIDWELADIGDPAWDAGAVFQTYLALWILSMPGATATVEQLAAFAGSPLERMLPVLRAFWTGYCAARDIPLPDRRRHLRRAVRYAGARMIQTAFEMAVASRQASLHTALLVQLSRNLLTRTDEAIRRLLELGE